MAAICAMREMNKQRLEFETAATVNSLEDDHLEYKVISSPKLWIGLGQREDMVNMDNKY